MEAGDLITGMGPDGDGTWMVLWGADEPAVALYPQPDGTTFVLLEVSA